MNWTPQNDVSVGTVNIVTTSGEGHSPEYYAQRIMDKLMHVGDQAPQPIRDQAHAFRDRMHAVVLAGIRQAIADDRAYRK